MGGASGAGSGSRRRTASNFYRQSLTEAEQIDLGKARGVEGLDDEIALLRVMLKSAVAERPDDVQLLIKGFELLVKAVGTRYRLSPKARGDLADNLTATLNSLGDQLVPD